MSFRSPSRRPRLFTFVNALKNKGTPGRMGIRMSDGTEGEIGPGDVASIAPGHDAWVVGDEPCIAVDFGGYAQYAKG